MKPEQKRTLALFIIRITCQHKHFWSPILHSRDSWKSKVPFPC